MTHRTGHIFSWLIAHGAHFLINHRSWDIFSHDASHGAHFLTDWLRHNPVLIFKTKKCLKSVDSRRTCIHCPTVSHVMYIYFIHLYLFMYSYFIHCSGIMCKPYYNILTRYIWRLAWRHGVVWCVYKHITGSGKDRQTDRQTDRYVLYICWGCLPWWWWLPRSQMSRQESEPISSYPVPVTKTSNMASVPVTKTSNMASVPVTTTSNMASLLTLYR